MSADFVIFDKKPINEWWVLKPNNTLKIHTHADIGTRLVNFDIAYFAQIIVFAADIDRHRRGCLVADTHDAADANTRIGVIVFAVAAEFATILYDDTQRRSSSLRKLTPTRAPT